MLLSLVVDMFLPKWLNQVDSAAVEQALTPLIQEKSTQEAIEQASPSTDESEDILIEDLEIEEEIKFE